MKIPFSSLLTRVTGISTPFGGASWVPPKTDNSADVASGIITFLENRRVLYVPYDVEVVTHVIESILEIRRRLNEALQELDRTSPLFATLAAMQAACIKFLDSTQRIVTGHHRIPPNTTTPSIFAHLPHTIYDLHGAREWEFLSALGELRGVFGICITKVAVEYHIDVDDCLLPILPGEPAPRADQDDAAR